MRFVTVHLRCDKEDCPVVGEEGDGTVVERTLSIDGKRGKTFLLCKPHLDELDEIVLPLMAKGVAVELPSSKGKRSAASSAGNGSGTSTVGGAEDSSSSTGTLVCQVPDCDRHGRPLASRTGMAQHVIRSHGYENLAAYEAEHGTVG